MRRPLVPVCLAALAFVAVSLTGCSETLRPPDGPAASGTTALAPLPEEALVCGDPVRVPLMTGAFRTLGFVSVENNESGLTVLLEAAPGFVLTHSDVAVVTSPSDFPVNRRGQPVLARFPWRTKHMPPVSEFAYEMSLGELGALSGDSLYVAVHALVHSQRGRRGGPDELWARMLLPVDGASHAKQHLSYFAYVVQSCAPPAPPCALTLVSPVGDEVVCTESVWEVQWESSGPCAETVRVELLFDGAVCATLAESAPNTGVFAWENAQPCGAAPYGYTIRLSDAGGTAVSESPQPFWIETCGGGE